MTIKCSKPKPLEKALEFVRNENPTKFLTIEVSESLHESIKIRAAKEKASIKNLFTRVMTDYLEKHKNVKQ
jgi:predicted HicB family RNase H-like nuclease